MLKPMLLSEELKNFTFCSILIILHILSNNSVDFVNFFDNNFEFNVTSYFGNHNWEIFFYPIENTAST